MVAVLNFVSRYLELDRSANELPFLSIRLGSFPGDPARFRRSSHSCTHCVRCSLYPLGLYVYLHSNRRRNDSSVCSRGNPAYRHRSGFLSTLPPYTQSKPTPPPLPHHTHHPSPL